MPSDFLIVYSDDLKVTKLIMGTILISLKYVQGPYQGGAFIFSAFHFYKRTLMNSLMNSYKKLDSRVVGPSLIWMKFGHAT